MNTLLTSITALFLLTLLSCGNAEKDQASDTAKTGTAYDPEKPRLPVEVYNWMASQEGIWKAEITFMNSPETVAGMPAEMIQENTLDRERGILNSVCKGKAGLKSFNGEGIMFYSINKIYNRWRNYLGIGIMEMEGTYHETTRTLDMTGTISGSARDSREVPVHSICRMIDAKTQVMELYLKMAGREYKMFEMKLVKQ